MSKLWCLARKVSERPTDWPSCTRRSHEHSASQSKLHATAVQATALHGNVAFKYLAINFVKVSSSPKYLQCRPQWIGVLKMVGYFSGLKAELIPPCERIVSNLVKLHFQALNGSHNIRQLRNWMYWPKCKTVRFTDNSKFLFRVRERLIFK